MIRRRAMKDALLLIGGFGCENYTRGHCEGAGRLRDADFTADAWCDACIANAALGRPRGRENHLSKHAIPVPVGTPEATT